MTSKTYSVIFGVFFILLGILSLVPKFTPNGYFIDLLRVNGFLSSFWIITGIAALFASQGTLYARWYFKIFAAVYLFLAVLGFMVGGNLMLFRLNLADNILHLIVGGIAAYLGYGRVPHHRK